MKNIHLYILFATLTFLSCKKDGNSYVKGQVLEYDTGNPISGVTVSLNRSFKDNNRAVQHVVVNSTISDQNGYYQINYHKKLFNSYYISWTHGALEYLPNYDEYSLDHRKTAHTISLIPVGYLKIRIKKNSNSNKYVTVNFNSPDQIPTIVTNYQFDTLIPKPCRVYAGFPTNIFWTIQPDNISNNITVTATRGDTLIYLIEFN